VKYFGNGIKQLQWQNDAVFNDLEWP